MSTALLLWGLLFSSIGLGYFVYGRRQDARMSLYCGVALMGFPYFISSTFLMVIIGLLLTALPFFLRR